MTLPWVRRPCGSLVQENGCMQSILLRRVLLAAHSGNSSWCRKVCERALFFLGASRRSSIAQKIETGVGTSFGHFVVD